MTMNHHFGLERETREASTLETRCIQPSSCKESEMELPKNITYNPVNVQIHTSGMVQAWVGQKLLKQLNT